MANYKKYVTGSRSDGTRTQQDLHRHLMEVHLGRKLGRLEVVHHINEDKHDNRLENLQVMTFKEHNTLHATKGEAIKTAKLTSELVRAIRKETAPIREVGRKYGVSHSTITRVQNRILWGHVV